MKNERDIKYAAFVADDEKHNLGRLVNSCDELRYFITHPMANKIVAKHNENSILTYATIFSPYYKQYAQFTHLQDFPVVTKATLKEHWDEIAVQNFHNTPLCIKFTSGSTGTPFKMVLDQYKHARWIAGNKVFRELVGVRSHEKTLFISETIKDDKISHDRMERDNVFYIRVPYLDDVALKNIISSLMNDDYKSMTAMASIYDRIARLISSGDVPQWEGNLLSLFSVSEPLKEKTRKIISEYFNCPIYVFYANEENGVLGVEDGSGYGLRANDVDFKLEVLKLHSDEPATDGEIGRLVITDYYNKAFPIIRYENGDLVSVKLLDDGRLYITEVVGRLVDALYATDGRMVNYFDGISFMEEFQDIIQFQLIQNDYHHFKWVLNTKNHNYEDLIQETSKKLFGVDSIYEFEYVDAIPKLRSGKTRMTICNIKFD